MVLPDAGHPVLLDLLLELELLLFVLGELLFLEFFHLSEFSSGGGIQFRIHFQVLFDVFQINLIYIAKF